MIGTPNHGTYGYLADFCGTLIRNPTPECQDMEAGSDFLTNLNSDDETPGNIKYLTIIGKNTKSNYNPCPDKGYTDNVICASSVYLEGAENYYYEDYSSEYYLMNSLHTAFVYPSKAPLVYNKIVSFIKN